MSKINIKKNIRRRNSTQGGQDFKKKKKIRNDEFKNVIETFKNKSVNLFNHNNNMRKVKIIQERLNNI